MGRLAFVCVVLVLLSGVQLCCAANDASAGQAQAEATKSTSDNQATKQAGVKAKSNHVADAQKATADKKAAAEAAAKAEADRVAAAKKAAEKKAADEAAAKAEADRLVAAKKAAAEEGTPPQDCPHKEALAPWSVYLMGEKGYELFSLEEQASTAFIVYFFLLAFLEGHVHKLRPLGDYITLVRPLYHMSFGFVLFPSLYKTCEPGAVNCVLTESVTQQYVLLYLSFNVCLYGGIYTLNALTDRAEDAAHPRKRVCHQRITALDCVY
jgi:hypothetical protein